MATVLICAGGEGPDFHATVIGRSEFTRRRASTLEEASKLGPQAALALIERDLPWALALVRGLRRVAPAPAASIAIFAPDDDAVPLELELLDAGANAILRLPPSAEWDRRLARLIQVAQRRKARVAIHLRVEGSLDATNEPFTAETLDLSETGMFVECGSPLAVGTELFFALQLPGRPGLVSGRARVLRVAGHHRYGMEFTSLGGEEYESLRGFFTEEASERP